MDKKRFTVVIPTFNRAQIALKSIQSVVLDPNVDQCLILDDGSDISDFNIIKEFCDKFSNITIRRQHKNLGFSSSLRRALAALKEASTDYVFLCESDMLLSKGWGDAGCKVFEMSAETKCLVPMLHKDFLQSDYSESFYSRCTEGFQKSIDGGSIREIQKPFGSECYKDLPSQVSPIGIHRHKIFFSPNGCTCTLIFDRKFFQKLPTEEVLPEFGDAWLSWQSYLLNDLNPRTIAILDPGLALTIGDEGLSGNMWMHNSRWAGSFWWRNNFSVNTMKWFGKLINRNKAKIGKTGFPAYIKLESST